MPSYMVNIVIEIIKKRIIGKWLKINPDIHLFKRGGVNKTF
jgi:hypothetical protein